MLRGGQPAERGFQRAVLVAVPGPILVVPAALLFSGMRGRKLLVALGSPSAERNANTARVRATKQSERCVWNAPTSAGAPQNSTAAYRADERRAAPRRDAP